MWDFSAKPSLRERAGTRKTGGGVELRHEGLISYSSGEAPGFSRGLAERVWPHSGGEGRFSNPQPQTQVKILSQELSFFCPDSC